jgi:hypothetical protein
MRSLLGTYHKLDNKSAPGVVLLAACAFAGLACAPGRLVAVSYGQQVREYEQSSFPDSEMQVVELGYAPAFLHPVYGARFGIGDEETMSAQAWASYDMGFFVLMVFPGSEEDGPRRVWPVLRPKVGIEWDGARDKSLQLGVGGAIGFTLSLGGRQSGFPPNMLSIEYEGYVDTNGDRTSISGASLCAV